MARSAASRRAAAPAGSLHVSRLKGKEFRLQTVCPYRGGRLRHRHRRCCAQIARRASCFHGDITQVANLRTEGLRDAVPHRRTEGATQRLDRFGQLTELR